MTGRRQERTPAALVLATVLGLLAGCAEPGAMPTRPLPSSASDWRQIYPAATNEHLNAAWGLDDDDMWAVGNRGAIVRWDGRRATLYPSGTTNNLMAIDGLARGDIWTVSRAGEVLHWDGRRWQIEAHLDASLFTICSPSADHVYVAGRQIGNQGSEAVIWRREGRDWREMPLSDQAQGHEFLCVWQPQPGWPVFAATDRDLYVLDGAAWRRTAEINWFFDATADVMILGDPDDCFFRPSLHRLHPDGSLTMECTAFYVFYSEVVALSRFPLLTSEGDVRRVESCYGTKIAECSFSINDLALPLLANPQRSSVFAVGRYGGFARLTWNIDNTMHRTDLLLPAENRRVDALTGTGEHLYVLDRSWTGGVYRRAGSTWQSIATPFPPVWIDVLDDGGVAIARAAYQEFQLAIADDDGWREQPSLPRTVGHWWVGDDRICRALTHDWSTPTELLGLDGGDWYHICTLDSSAANVVSFAGFATDDLYIAGPERLLHFDGDSMSEVVPRIGNARLRAGRRTGRLYLEGWHQELGDISGYLQGGRLTIVGPRLWWQGVHEVDEDRIFCYTTSEVYRLVDDQWQPLSGPDRSLYTGLWGHPEQGLFVVNQESAIFHRDLPGSAP